MNVNKDLCDLCGTCVSVCPVDAIVIGEFIISLDSDVCTDCKSCKTVCPVKAIREGDN